MSRWLMLAVTVTAVFMQLLGTTITRVGRAIRPGITAKLIRVRAGGPRHGPIRQAARLRRCRRHAVQPAGIRTPCGASVNS
jgi:hypothetical protein